MKTKTNFIKVIIILFLMMHFFVYAEEHLNLTQKEFKTNFYTSNDTLFRKSDSSIFKGTISIYKPRWLFWNYKYSSTKYGHDDYQWYEDTLFYKSGEVRVIERKYIQRVYPRGEYHWLYNKIFLSKSEIRTEEMLFVDSTLTISKYYNSNMTPISYYKVYETKEGTCSLHEDYFYRILDSNDNYVSNVQKRIFWGKITYFNHKWHGYYDFQNEKGNLIQKKLYLNGKLIGSINFDEEKLEVISVKLERKYGNKNMTLKEKVDILNKYAEQIKECNLDLEPILLPNK